MVTPKDSIHKLQKGDMNNPEIIVNKAVPESSLEETKTTIPREKATVAPTTQDSSADRIQLKKVKVAKRSATVNSKFSRMKTDGGETRSGNNNATLTGENKRDALNMTSQEEPLKPTGFKENMPKSKLKNLYLAYGRQNYTEARKSALKIGQQRPKSSL